MIPVIQFITSHPVSRKWNISGNLSTCEKFPLWNSLPVSPASATSDHHRNIKCTSIYTFLRVTNTMNLVKNWCAKIEEDWSMHAAQCQIWDWSMGNKITEKYVFASFEFNKHWELNDYIVSGPELLTHCGLVTPYGDRDLGQHWFR